LYADLRTYNSSIVVVFQHWEALYSVQSPLSHWPPPARTGFNLRAGGGVAWADLNIDYKQCLLDYYDETICDSYVDEFHRDLEDTIDGGIIGIVHATREQSIWLCGSDACGFQWARSVMVQEPGSGV
jgi:hypothetical protein